MEASFLVPVALKRYNSSKVLYLTTDRKQSAYHSSTLQYSSSESSHSSAVLSTWAVQPTHWWVERTDKEERWRPGLSKCWRCRWQDRGEQERREAQSSFSVPHSAVNRWQAGRRTSFSGASTVMGCWRKPRSVGADEKCVCVFPEQFAAMYLCPLRRVLRGTTRTFFFSLI